MSSSVSGSPGDSLLDWDPKISVPSARAMRSSDRTFTILGVSIDALWIHCLRKSYIGPPRALNTAGVYAFWAATWYCASNSGEWTHAAIARDRERLQAASVPPHADDAWAGHTPASTNRVMDVPLERQEVHFVAYSGLCNLPAFARLLYAYRPLFWRRSLPFKVIWGGAAALCSQFYIGWTYCMSQSQSQAWESRALEEGRTG